MKNFLLFFAFSSFFLLQTSCKKRNFENSSSVAESTQNQKHYGGPFNFGITFSKVDEVIANDFWNGRKNENSFSSRILKTAKIGVWDGEPSENLSFSQIVHPTAAKDIDKIVREYFKHVNKWLQLACQDVDMNQAAKGKLVVTLKKHRSANDMQAPCNFRKKSTDQAEVTDVVFSPVAVWAPRADLPKNDPDFGNSRSAFTFRTIDDVWTSPSKPLAIAVSVAPEITVGSELYTTHSEMMFIISGNYIYPLHSWKISKSFAVPVMRFIGDSKNPDYLKTVAFYDFGLLTLNALPKEGNMVASRMSDSAAASWKDPVLKPKTGFLVNGFENRVNQFLSPNEHIEKKLGFDFNMERAIIGSTHFVINSFWVQRRGGLDNLMVVMDIKREELINLYLGDSHTGQVWVNTLDRLRNADASQYDVFKKMIETKNCKLGNQIIGQQPGTYVETELIVGGGAGRKLIHNKKSVILACTFGAHEFDSVE